MEYTLGVITWYRENGENKHATARNFGIGRKRLREWLEYEDRLRDNRVGAAKKKRNLVFDLVASLPIAAVFSLVSGMWKPHPIVRNAHAQRGRYHGINITQYRESAPHQFFGFLAL